MILHCKPQMYFWQFDKYGLRGLLLLLLSWKRWSVVHSVPRSVSLSRFLQFVCEQGISANVLNHQD